MYFVAGADEVHDEAERERAEAGVEKPRNAPRIAGAIAVAVRIRRRAVRCISHLEMRQKLFENIDKK